MYADIHISCSFESLPGAVLSVCRSTFFDDSRIIFEIYRQPSPFAGLPFAVSTIRGNFFESCFAIRDSFPRLFAVFVTLLSSFIDYHKSITLYVSPYYPGNIIYCFYCSLSLHLLLPFHLCQCLYQYCSLTIESITNLANCI